MPGFIIFIYTLNSGNRSGIIEKQSISKVFFLHLKRLL